ncbi:MAG: InlB B-repeat-containing protein [Lachnospiraceae bacterium]|nr:InlB B-repeat-containing protein [Lachnospiraceae bacterium]
MKNKNLKSILAGIIAAAMVLSSLPLPAFAGNLPGQGLDDPAPEISEEDREDGQTEGAFGLSDEAGEADRYSEISGDSDELSGITEDEEEDGTEHASYGTSGEDDEYGPYPENVPADDDPRNGYLDVPGRVKIQSVGDLPKYGSGLRRISADGDGEQLPSSYIPDQEYLPQLRSQGTFGTCWAFSSIALAELSLIKQGIAEPDDLSELHLAYFTYHTATDPLGGLAGDRNQAVGKDYLARGGNLFFSSSILSAWTGAVNEAEVPYSSASTSLTLPEEDAFTDSTYREAHEGTAAHLTDYYEVLLRDADNNIDWSGMQEAKRLIRDYGGMGISYYSVSGTSPDTNTSVYSEQHNCYYDPDPHLDEYDYMTTNHAVTVVGWDDDFPKEYFAYAEKPAGNGAWLIRNSWTKGGDYADHQNYSGYFWMSYYNVAFSDVGYAFRFGSASDYDNNYQYDGAMFTHVRGGVPSGANVFTAHAAGGTYGEILKAASFYSNATNCDYTIDVYTGIPANTSDPTDGTKISTTTGSFKNSGYHTIELSSPVALSPNDRFFVVVTLSKSGETPNLGFEYSSGGSRSWYSSSATVASGQSFYKYAGQSAWTDCASQVSSYGNLRIKAFTVNRESDNPIPPTKISFGGGIAENGVELAPTETFRPEVTILPADATDQTLLWESSNDSVATVNRRGVVTGVAEGTAVITATARLGGESASYTVTVIADKLASISITSPVEQAAGTYYYLGEEYQFSIVKSPANAVTSGEVTWSSSDSSVLSIDSTGLGRVMSVGDAVISATLDGKEASLAVSTYLHSPEITASADEDSVVTLSWPAVYAAQYYKVMYKNSDTALAEIQAVEGQETYTFTDENFRGEEDNISVTYYVYAYYNRRGMGAGKTVYLGPSYRITYVTGAHADNPERNPVRYRPGEYYSLTKAVCHTGYLGGTWYKDSAYETGAVYSISSSSTGDITLYAKVDPIKYNVTFYPNGGKIGDSYQYMEQLRNIPYDYEFSLPLNEYSMAGAEFAGWNTKDDGTGTSYADGATVKSLTSTDYGFVYLYAQWRYTVTLDPQGGTLGEGEDTLTAYVQRPYGELPVPARDGYNFIGWFRGTYSSAPKITAETVCNVTGPHTLYAHWERKPAAEYDTEPAAKTNLTYTGGAQALLTAGSSEHGTVQYKLGADGNYGASVPTATDAGTYTVYCRITATDGVHSDSAETQISVTIQKADPVFKTAPAAIADLIYTGEAQTLITAGATDHGTIQYRLSSGSYGTSLPTGKNAGTYSVYYKIVGDGNHKDSGEVLLSPVIGRAEPSCTAPSAVEGLGYLGVSQTLISRGSTSDGTMKYRLGTEGEFTTSLPKATEAGTYSVYYMVAGDSNHTDKVWETPVSVKIDKAAGSLISLPRAKTVLFYTGSAQALISGGSVTGGKFVYSLTGTDDYSETIPTGINADTYIVYYKVEADEDHSVPAGSSGTLEVTIRQKNITGATVSVSGTYTYTGEPIVPSSVTVKLGETTLDPENDYTVTASDNTAAGTAKIRILGKGNYSGEAAGSFTIGKTTITASAVSLSERRYQPALTSVTVTGVTFMNGSTEVSLVSGTDYTASAVLEDDAAGEDREAEVTIILLNPNYELTSTKVTGKVTILKAQHENVTVNGSECYGMTAAVDLSAYIIEGAELGAVNVTEDESEALSGTPYIDETDMLFTFKDDETLAGAVVKIEIPVTNADSYEDYKILITLTVSTCAHENTEVRGMLTATCTEKGYTGDTYCTDCGKLIQRGEETDIDPDNHDYDDGVETIAPTILSEGEKTFTCSRCHHSYTETLPAIEDGEDHSTLIGDITDGEGNSIAEITTGQDEEGGTQTTVTVGGAEVETTVTDEETGKTETMSQIWTAGLHTSYPYTGSVIKPEIHIYDGTKLLVEKTDYKLTYGKNTNVSTGGTIKISFIGNYKTTSAKTLSFEIAPEDMGTALITYDKAVTAKGKPGRETVQKPVPSVVWRSTGKALSSKQYSIAYYPAGEEDAEKLTGVSAPGEYTAVFTPKNTNLTGSIRAKISVTGTAADEKSQNLANAKISLFTSGKKKIYTGEAIELEEDTDYSITDSLGNRLDDGVDYEVTYQNNLTPGTATAIFTALPDGAYSGTKKINFKIAKGRVLSEENGIEIEYDEAVPYVKGGSKPAVKVTDNGRVLKNGTDYTVSYKKNTRVTGELMAESDCPYLTVKGKGYYKGTLTGTFTIEPGNLGAEGMTITAADKAVGKKGYEKPSLTVKDTNGKALSAKTDYRISDYDAPDEEGYVTVYIEAREGSNYEGEASAVYRYYPATSFLNRVKLYRKIPNKTYTGREISLTDEELSGLLYTGKKKTPAFLEPGEDGDFKVVSYTNNKKKGTAKVLLQGVNDYAGTRTLTFRIVQKKGVYCGTLVDGEWIQ